MFVILGATGKVGRTTIKQLRSQRAPVRAAVRKSSNADDLSALGCEVVAADLNDAAAIKVAIRLDPDLDSSGYRPKLCQIGFRSLCRA
jgi:NAD(P)H dehydrogenase (quinone)